MIKHIVMFRFRSDLDDGTRAALIEEYKSFPKTFPSMRNFSFGTNKSERDNTFEYAFSVEFENKSALKAYLSSKEHEEHVVERFRPALQSRAIVSYEIED